MLLLIMLAGPDGASSPSVDVFYSLTSSTSWRTDPDLHHGGDLGREGPQLCGHEHDDLSDPGRRMISLLGLIAIYVKGGGGGFDFITLREPIDGHPLAETCVQKHVFGLLPLLGFGILVSLWPFHHLGAPAGGMAPPPARPRCFTPGC